MKTRRLTRLTHRNPMRTFDITRDNQRIVFDRLRENSEGNLPDDVVRLAPRVGPRGIVGDDAGVLPSELGPLVGCGDASQRAT